MHENRFAHATFEKHPAGAFENHELDVSIGVILEDDRRTGNRGRDRSGGDLGAARILRDLEEHGAAAEFEIARAFSKTEDRVRAEARERLIGKGEFGAGLDSSAYGGAVAHFVADYGRAG